MDATLTDPSTPCLKMLIAVDNKDGEDNEQMCSSAGLNSGLKSSVHVFPPRQQKLTVGAHRESRSLARIKTRRNSRLYDPRPRGELLPNYALYNGNPHGIVSDTWCPFLADHELLQDDILLFCDLESN
jgi:hypothetical protein